jgi:hypothetical protein
LQELRRRVREPEMELAFLKKVIMPPVVGTRTG